VKVDRVVDEGMLRFGRVARLFRMLPNLERRLIFIELPLMKLPSLDLRVISRKTDTSKSLEQCF
jgi:hypothetical protein